MAALDLLCRVSALGGTAEVVGERLQLRAPKPLPDGLLSEIRAHKAEVLRLLTRQRQPDPDTDLPPAAISKGRGHEWDAETARLIQWFLDTKPPAKRFELCRGVTVANPRLYWKAIRSDIAQGPDGPRARYGALQADLRRLAKLFSGTAGLKP